jgi:single-stranded-DNA-specific exonuclease
MARADPVFVVPGRKLDTAPGGYDELPVTRLVQARFCGELEIAWADGTLGKRTVHEVVATGGRPAGGQRCGRDDGGGILPERVECGVDLGGAVIAARQAGLLIDGGGHTMAAGLTVAADAMAEARDFLRERLARALTSSGYVPSLGLDGAVNPRGATAELVRTLERLGPYGTGNAEPRFAVPQAQIVKPEVVGEKHVRCYLTGPDGGRLKAIAFRAVDRPLGRALLENRGVPLHVAGKLRLDQWAGRDNVQLIIEDAAAAGR